jgi:hypothetical protein
MVCAVLGLYTPSWCWNRSPQIGTSSISWAQLSRLHLKTETESSIRNVVFWNINRTVDSVQKNNICTNVPSSQTLDLINICCVSAETIRIESSRFPVFVSTPLYSSYFFRGNVVLSKLVSQLRHSQTIWWYILLIGAPNIFRNSIIIFVKSFHRRSFKTCVTITTPAFRTIIKTVQIVT